MAIVQDEYLKYDSDGHYYYLTEVGLIKYTGKDYLLDLWDINGLTEQRLKTQGRMLHNKYIESAYNGNILRYRHRDIIEYMVFKDEHGERDAIIQSLTEIVYATEDMDWDVKVRIGQAEWLPMILQPISDAGVYFQGQINYIVPEDEYGVGY
jgi:hypothetical protein